MDKPAQGGPRLLLRAASEADTVQIAETVARIARPGDVIGLRGDLGSGKTAFARGFIRALVGRQEEVPSPTFTLLQVYQAATPVYHFDLYRIEAPSEVWELGFDEARFDGIVLIEWPERLGPLAPVDRLDIAFSLPAGAGDAVRLIRIEAGPSWHARLGDAAPALERFRDG